MLKQHLVVKTRGQSSNLSLNEHKVFGLRYYLISLINVKQTTKTAQRHSWYKGMHMSDETHRMCGKQGLSLQSDARLQTKWP